MAAPAARILLHALPWLLLAGCADPAAPRLGQPAAPDAPEAPAPGIGTPADASGAGPAAAAADLADAGARLARYLAAAEARVSAPACLREDQQAWETQTQQRCGTDTACLDLARDARAAVLEGLVPGALLEAGGAPGADVAGGRLLVVAGGGDGDGDGVGGTGTDAPVIVEIAGVPRETDGGVMLTGAGFDAEAYAEFEALLGDEEGMRARFGDGPLVFTGVAGAFPTLAFDVGDLAAIESAVAGGRHLRVRGWASPGDEPPTLDAGRCLLVHDLGSGATR